MDFNGGPRTSYHHVATQGSTCTPCHPHQITPVTGSQQGFNNWGPDMITFLARDYGNPGMDHQDGTMLTYGDAPPAQPATTAGYKCVWIVKQSQCGEWFSTLAELVVHLGGTHDARGTANRPLICQWDIGRGPCNAEFRRDNLKRHIQTHFGIVNVCEDCGKPYSRADTLKKHVKNHHPKQRHLCDSDSRFIVPSPCFVFS
ncbi:hypothetical protein BDN67DRAFT_108 [Paxillus ammoniavirescens]|nr:hypothetical protein BDN67DRAFT_108 [Paxillus ammoniavirescens]